MTEEVTLLLNAIDSGDSKAADELLPLVYEELRRLASKKMSAQPAGHTLQATALVHEAWIRISKEEHTWQNRRHFFSAAAESMRRILVDQARRKQRVRHGGELARLNLDDVDIAMESTQDEMLHVNEALERLAEADPSKAELVKLRYFVGMSIPEAAEAMGMSASTAKRHWTFARAWLFDQLREPNTTQVN